MTIFFMHITKTAGGSLKELLRRSNQAGDDIIFHYNGESGFKPKFDYDHFPRILYGHYSYGVHKKAGLPANYACFLRSPIARTVSHYHHLKNNDFGPIGDKVRSFETMSDFLIRSKHWEFDNFLTRLISGVSNEVPYGEVGYNIYEKAMYNLGHDFSYIGIFENMQKSLEKLQPILPKIKLKMPSVNIGKYSRKTTVEEMKLLRSINRFDDLIYEEAVSIFNKK